MKRRPARKAANVALDSRFEQHRRIEPSRCPGGVVMRLVDARGRLVHERLLDTSEDAEVHAAVDAELADDVPGTVYLYAYDGDTGECMGTLIAEPTR